MSGVEIELKEMKGSPSFLDGYHVKRIVMEKEGEPKSGKGTVHYVRNGKDYTLEVEYVNGMKQGKAVLLDSNHIVVGNLTFSNDKLNGECVLRNEKYMVVFRGVMKNGVKDGECHEYDDEGKEIWHGIYIDGKKEKELSASTSVTISNPISGLVWEKVKDVKSLKGYYREIVDGKMVSISRVNGKKVKKGKCFEFVDGTLVKECLYKKGRVKRVIREFNGDEMKEYDSKGFLVYEGKYSGDYKSSFIRNGKGKEYENAGKDLVYDGDHVDGYREGHGVSFKKGHVMYSGQWKEGYPCGEGSISDMNGNTTHSGVWNNGYLVNGSIVVDFESGKRRLCCGGCSNRMRRVRFRKWWNRKSKCSRFWLGLLFWVVLLFVCYEIILTLVMMLKAGFQNELTVETYEGFTHIPFFMKGCVRQLRFRDACKASQWIKRLDLSSFKNLESLIIEGSSFHYVTSVTIKSRWS